MMRILQDPHGQTANAVSEKNNLLLEWHVLVWVLFRFDTVKSVLGEMAEPEWLIKSTIEDCGGKENVAPEFLDGVTYFKDGKYLKMREFQ